MNEQKWVETKKEYVVDGGIESLQKITKELKTDKLEYKDKIDLIFKVFGVIAIIGTLIGTLFTIRNLSVQQRNDYKKQLALYQLQTYTDAITIVNSLINVNPDPTVNYGSLNKLKNELLPRIELFQDSIIINRLKKFSDNSSQYLLIYDLSLQLNQDDRKFKQDFSVLVSGMNYFNDTYIIDAKAISKAKENGYITYMEDYLDKKSIYIQGIEEQMERVPQEKSSTSLFNTDTTIKVIDDIRKYYKNQLQAIVLVDWDLRDFPKDNKGLIKFPDESNGAILFKYYFFNVPPLIDPANLIREPTIKSLKIQVSNRAKRFKNQLV